ncbi:MAG: sulfatase-like hydrolase/transferase [Lentisphaeria bacterium]|nr:sulfatase-like hydrolase/transferase [Candidatus Neomarinimicrobiota bacterium]MCF7841348.1 sulfatase-like hydrolase/transferase [Lentisphaeria bacterium]
MPPHPPILLISLDATRYDYLIDFDQTYRWPFFRQFVNQAHHFAHAYTPSPWTPPAHASLFTGLAPWEHGVVEGQLWLENQHLTLAGFLGERDYRTIGISSNPLLGPVTNLNKDFQSFYEVWKNPERLQQGAQFLRFDDIILNSSQVQTKVLEILASELDENLERPTFLFLQLIGPHNPFQPSQGALEKFVGFYPDTVWEQVIRYNQDWRNYYAEGRNMTTQEQSLLLGLYQAELDDLNSMLATLFTLPWFQHVMEVGHVIITADHGEMLGEHNHIHHLFNLYEPLIHVPLLWRIPHQGKMIIHDEFIQHQHIFPLLQQMLIGEQDVLDEWQSNAPEQVVAQLLEPVEILQGLDKLNPHTGDIFRHHQIAIQDNMEKTIWHSNGQHEFFDISIDQGENSNLFPTDAGHFRKKLEECEAIFAANHPNQTRVNELMWKLGYF